MKVTRANEYWGIPEDTPQRTAATPLSRDQIEDLLRGPRVYAGMLHFAEDAEDPSLTDKTRSLIPKVVPHIQRLEHDLGNEGGSSPNDGTPERWPVILPGDKLMSAGGSLADTGLDVLESKTPKRDSEKKVGRRYRYAAAPDPNDLTPTGEYNASTHGAKTTADSTGQRWLVKPPRDNEHWPAALDVATAQLQQRAGLATPEIHSVNMRGVPTPVHKMIPGAEDAFPGKRFDHASASPEDIMELQKHNIFDWMISNHDAHPGQFIRDPQGQLMGIDKGQAYRYFGADKLDPNFHPNGPEPFGYYEEPPIYSNMWKNFASGKGHMNNPTEGELGQFLQNLQSIPDDEFKEILRPYASLTAQVGKLGTGGGLGQPGHIRANDPDSFLEHATRRKNNLGSDFANLYQQALGRRGQQHVGRRRVYV